MSEQSHKDIRKDAPANHCQDLPVERFGKGCYTISGAKTAGQPVQKGDVGCDNSTNQEYIMESIVRLLQRASIRDLKVILQFVQRLIK